MKSAPKIRQQVFLGSALAGSLFTGYLRRAYAACTGAGGTYACSGALTTTQTLNASSLTVTTNSGFGIATAAGDAMNLTATTGGLSFTDAFGSSIAGANRGIYAYNMGNSALSITTTGTVTATRGNGIYAKSYGAGSVTITSTGTVTATNGIGVFGNSSGAGSVTIQTAAVTGGTAGVEGKILRASSGALSITTTGPVTAASGIGVYARTYGTGLTIQTAAVTGATEGIDGRSINAGALSITSTGTVTGTAGDGIHAQNSGTNLTIQAANVSGAQYGIRAYNFGAGALSITTTGTVTGGIRGIYAKNYAGTDLTIQVAGASGPRIGIDARNFGSGTLSITSTGSVNGGVRGINAVTTAGHSIDINTTSLGAIQGVLNTWTSPAVQAVGGPTTITNNGALTGVVHLDTSGFANAIANGGVWNTLGAGNVFGSTGTITNNAGGTIFTSMPGAVAPVTTTFSGLAAFTNAGLISMHNGVVGDQTVITSNFIGRGGSVALDVALGSDNSVADQLVFKGGNASGTTNLLIYNVGGLGALTTADGIQVVKVENGGTTAPTAFQLGRTVAAGAYTYTLFYGGNGATGGNPSDQDWYLRSTLTPIPPPLLLLLPPRSTPIIARKFPSISPCRNWRTRSALR